MSCNDQGVNSVDTALHTDRILILDFGSQYTQLIARRIREANVFCELRSFDISASTLRDLAPKGIILSGGPESVYQREGIHLPEEVFTLGVPVLGICYGMQAMATTLGGDVEASGSREFGYAQVRARGHSTLLRGIEDRSNPQGHGLLDVWMSHADQVTALPAGFKCIASTQNAPIAGMADESRRFYGLQFHPEVTHTAQGGRILAQFVKTICQCTPNWTPANIITESIAAIRRRVGRDRVLLGLSGGVDSAVVAALLHRAIGQQLVCIFVDHGLLRWEEGDEIMATFARHMGLNVIRVNTEERFFAALAGISDPEAKRKIIGELFVEVFEEQAQQLNAIHFLAQGTIYPDVIESAGGNTGKAHVIKSHHNVGGLPEHMSLELLEPLRELFKDEVRSVGLELGLSRKLLFRHPFPGPGLGVRVLGEVKAEYIDILRRADAIFIAELHAHHLYDQVSQAFAVYLPVGSVGVMGDQRRYEHVIVLRAVETADFMTARWAHLPYDFLSHVSNRIINEVPGISRVTYDISDKPPATIEWE